MTEEEFKSALEKELYSLFHKEKKTVPIKTGNLRNNAIQIMETPTGFRIWVDLDKAPYAEFLDDKPKIQTLTPEGWFNAYALNIIEGIMKKFNNSPKYGYKTTSASFSNENENSDYTRQRGASQSSEWLKELRRESFGYEDFQTTYKKDGWSVKADKDKVLPDKSWSKFWPNKK